ncbi:MAG TPA: FAD-dependent oxidoreductase [Microbacteriaceae bacterium]|nr:FAD-dependent oxidoreductase [Microbacteriaceae bacterium]
MSDNESIVIIGGGLAGAKAAEGAREAGWTGTIRLIGAEPYLPYERPPLTKGLLQGADGPQAAIVAKDGWATTHGVELLLGAPAESIDREARTVRVAGADVPYTKLVLAMGSIAPRPDLPGAHLDGVFVVRTLDDALALRDRLLPGNRVAVIGAGWIGTEVAASARIRGAEVTLLGRGSVPLERVLGREIGAFYASVHQSHGVVLRLGPDVTAIEGDEHATEVRLADGARIEAEVVVLGTGVRPELGLAEAAGLEIGGKGSERGVLADETLATSDPDVYVAGDIANAMHPLLGDRVRVEHWGNALHQGLAAGANAAGAGKPYDLLPYFFSDQYDIGMEYSGWPVEFDEVVVRGSVDDGEFIAFQLRDGIVVGGANINVWDVNEHVQDLVRAAAPVRREVLADPDVDPADWVKRATLAD